MSHVWDRFSIRAEINRRGETLASLERRYGLKLTTLKVALERPFPKGEKVISDFLNVPVKVLFAYHKVPIRKRHNLRQVNDSRVAPVEESQKCTTVADMEAAA